MPRDLRSALVVFSISSIALLGGCPKDPGADPVDCVQDPFHPQCPVDCVGHPGDPRCQPGQVENPHQNGGGPGDELVGCIAQEYCDGIDNNCDGQVDESGPDGELCDCPVEVGNPCYDGPLGTRGVGACTDGIQFCDRVVNGEAVLGECHDAVKPNPAGEICGNGVDDDCNGTVDDGCDTPPIVTCNPSQIFSSPLQTVFMSGTAAPGSSGFPIASQSWTVAVRPTGSTTNPVIVGGNPANVNLFLDVAGQFVMTFTATDTGGNVGTCNTVIEAIPTENLRIEVSWDKNDTDVDSHLLHPTATNWDNNPLVCHWRNCDGGAVLPWGAPGPQDDPRLDLDDIDGFGPENINIDVPELNAPYRFGVFYFSDHGNGPTNVTVKIFCGGVLAQQFGPQQLTGPTFGSSPNQLWKVADIVFTSGSSCQITPLNVILSQGANIPR